MPRLRNHDRAIVDERKLTHYALDPDSPRGGAKARVFRRALGFTADQWAELRAELLAGIATADAEFQRVDEFGEVYRTDVLVTGPTGRTAKVRAIWQYDRQSNGRLHEAPRLVTLYVL